MRALAWDVFVSFFTFLYRYSATAHSYLIDREAKCRPFFFACGCAVEGSASRTRQSRSPHVRSFSFLSFSAAQILGARAFFRTDPGVNG